MRDFCEMLKTRKYNGWLYPAIGSRSEYIGKHCEIEYKKTFTWYSEWFKTFIYIPFMLKVYIPDRNNDLNRNTLIKLHNNLFNIKYQVCSLIDDNTLATVNLYPNDTYSWEKYLYEAIPDNSFKMVSFYNQNGDYIGGIGDAVWLLRNNILNPQLALSENEADKGNTCSIGLYKKDGYKGWIGWSHRASCFFKIGDVLFDPNATLEDCKALFPDLRETYIENVPYNRRGKKLCVTQLDCKWAASNFARDVS